MTPDDNLPVPVPSVPATIGKDGKKRVRRKKPRPNTIKAPSERVDRLKKSVEAGRLGRVATDADWPKAIEYTLDYYNCPVEFRELLTALMSLSAGEAARLVAISTEPQRLVDILDDHFKALRNDLNAKNANVAAVDVLEEPPLPRQIEGSRKYQEARAHLSCTVASRLMDRLEQDCRVRHKTKSQMIDFVLHNYYRTLDDL